MWERESVVCGEVGSGCAGTGYEVGGWGERHGAQGESGRCGRMICWESYEILICKLSADCIRKICDKLRLFIKINLSDSVSAPITFYLLP